MGISFQFDNVRIGSGSLFLIAGPCVIESEDHAIRMAEIIKGVTRSLNLPFIFKASYDKANRTSLKSFRGPGLKEGLRILQKVKKEVKVPILTDVHEVSDGIDLVDHNVIDLNAGHLILDCDHQLKTIKPIAKRYEGEQPASPGAAPETKGR